MCAAAVWPDLPYSIWHETAATLQLWTQIVGKVRLTLTPWVNPSWQVPLYVTARGLGTSPIPIGSEILGRLVGIVELKDMLMLLSLEMDLEEAD